MVCIILMWVVIIQTEMTFNLSSMLLDLAFALSCAGFFFHNLSLMQIDRDDGIANWQFSFKHEVLWW